jgi:hypothetical protein
MPPDTVQAAGNLGHHCSPIRGPSWGTGPEHRLGHLECLQVHDLPATLELLRLYGIIPHYKIESKEAVVSLSRWAYEFG